MSPIFDLIAMEESITALEKDIKNLTLRLEEHAGGKSIPKTITAWRNAGSKRHYFDNAKETTGDFVGFAAVCGMGFDSYRIGATDQPRKTFCGACDKYWTAKQHVEPKTIDGWWDTDTGELTVIYRQKARHYFDQAVKVDGYFKALCGAGFVSKWIKTKDAIGFGEDSFSSVNKCEKCQATKKQEKTPAPSWTCDHTTDPAESFDFGCPCGHKFGDTTAAIPRAIIKCPACSRGAVMQLVEIRDYPPLVIYTYRVVGGEA